MKRSIILIASTLLISANIYAGGPWVNKKGKSYYKASYSWMEYTSYFDDDGETVSGAGKTSVSSTRIYGEYSLSDSFDIIADINVLGNNQKTERFPGDDTSLTAFGDMDLGLKYALTKDGVKFPVAASIILGLPTGNTDELNDAVYLNELQTGDGEFNQMLRLETGTSFNVFTGVNGYASVYAAYNNRTQDYSNEMRYGGEVGISFFKSRLWLAAKYNAISSFNNGDAINRPNNIYSNNVEFQSLGFEVNGYVTEKIGLSFSNAGTFTARNIGASASTMVGVFFDFTK